MTMVRYSEDVWGANKMTQILGSNSRITSDLISICKQIAKTGHPIDSGNLKKIVNVQYDLIKL